jgi:hypothetical protein
MKNCFWFLTYTFAVNCSSPSDLISSVLRIKQMFYFCIIFSIWLFRTLVTVSTTIKYFFKKYIYFFLNLNFYLFF